MPTPSDRELLELAARAAGIGLVWCDKYDAGHTDTYIVPHPLPHWVLAEWPHAKWNPLTDDGDALRLAVKLQIGLTFIPSNENGDPPLVNACRCSDGELHEAFEEGDSPEATRRAIVRAAASLAKDHP